LAQFFYCIKEFINLSQNPDYKSTQTNMKDKPRLTSSLAHVLILMALSSSLYAQLEPIPIPSVNGKVYAILPDTTGGIFIGGDFTQVDGVKRSRLAHLLKDGSVDLTWNPSVNGIVRSLVFFLGSPKSLVVGGDFTAINGQTRNHLASLNSDGTVSNWDPNVDGNIYVLLVGGPGGSNVLFVGGEFTNVSGQPRNNLAYINNGGNVMSFNPSVSGGGVYSLYFFENTLYVGGSFLSINDISRNGVASIRYPDKLTSWAPVITSSNGSAPRVLSINQSGNLLFLGGQFDTADGSARTCLAAYDITNGNLSATFNPILQSSAGLALTVNDITLLGNTTVLIGGTFARVNNQLRNNIAALSIENGNATAWDFSLNNAVYSIAVSTQSIGSDPSVKDYIFIGGQFTRGIHVVNTLLNQTITFASLANKKFGDAPFTLNATSSSGLPVTFASKNTNVATINGSTVTIVGAGTALIVASQDGNLNFNAATSQGQLLTVDKASQTISFGPLPGKTFGDASFDLNATATSGLPVTYTSSDPTVATVAGSKVTITGGGTTTITASQAGNSNYLAAAGVSQTLNVSKATQAITFTPLQRKTYGDAAFKLTAVASSGLPVSYSSSNTRVAVVSGSNVTIMGAGTTLISASQTGNSNYLAAADVAQAFIVDKANQSIVFQPVVPPRMSGAHLVLSASASSGLPVSFTSSNENILSISGNDATVLASGRVVITASQNGDGNFNAASSVNQEVTILITGIEPSNEISFYPNPVVNEVYIKTAGTDSKQFILLDHLGRQVFELSSCEELVKIEMTNFPSGMYLLRMGDYNHQQTVRLIKK
jgi:hypothetical protein